MAPVYIYATQHAWPSVGANLVLVTALRNTLNHTNWQHMSDNVQLFVGLCCGVAGLWH